MKRFLPMLLLATLAIPVLAHAAPTISPPTEAITAVSLLAAPASLLPAAVPAAAANIPAISAAPSTVLFAAVPSAVSGTLLALLGTVALLLIKFALLPAIAYLSKKAGAFLDAHAKKAESEHKLVNLARAERSLGNWALTGVQSVAQTAQADAAAGKPLDAIASDAVSAAKRYATSTGLQEVQELLGITTGALDAKLTALITPQVKAIVATKGSAPAVAAVPPVPAAG